MHTLTTLLRCLFVVDLCAGATSARAQKPEAISLTQLAPASLHLRVDNSTTLAGRVRIVRLSSGQILFTEAYPGPGMATGLTSTKYPVAATSYGYKRMARCTAA